LAALIAAYPQLTKSRDIQVADDLWLIAFTSTLCPLVSLLGAKRPQHQVWQFIVFSFWVVASLPALESLALHPGENLDVPIVWKCFYAGLWMLGCANYLPTRYALASVLVAAGQLCLFWRFFHAPAVFGVADPLIGVALLIAAVWMVSWLGRIADRR